MSGIILAVHYGELLNEAAHWLVIAFSVLLALVGARLIDQWVNGGIRTSDIHPGYFIPLVAGPFVIGLGMNDLGARPVATVAFGAGVFFWALIGAMVTAYFLGTDSPPADQLPLHAALLAAPGIACVAWVNLNLGPVDLIGDLLIGVLAAMVLVQIMLLCSYVPIYRLLTGRRPPRAIVEICTIRVGTVHLRRGDTLMISNWVAREAVSNALVHLASGAPRWATGHTATHRCRLRLSLRGAQSLGARGAADAVVESSSWAGSTPPGWTRSWIPPWWAGSLRTPGADGDL
jgi:hypothetical protein